MRGITRVFGVSLTWLTAYAKSVWQQAPDDLGARPSMLEIDSLEELEDFGIQMDEVWSFVATKINKVWIWLAYAPWKRQVIAFHLGRRDTASAKALWNQIVVEWQEHCCFDTDDWNAYKKVLPAERHYISKELTQHIERFNGTLRQRCSRVVRKTLSFSKKMENHYLALKYFFWQFNLEQSALHL